MGYITLKDCVSILEQSIGQIVSVSQSNEDLTESVNEYPMLKVYPRRGSNISSEDGNMERKTFGGGGTRYPVRMHEWEIHATYYIRPRSLINEEVVGATKVIDDLIDHLDEQIALPFFGIEGVKGMSYTWEYASDTVNEQEFSVVQFIFTLLIY